MTSYELALEVHSIVRLALTLASLLLLVLGLQGWSGNRDWGVGSKMLLLFTMILADVQLLIGLGLYFAWSPTAAAARADYGAAMKDPTTRYWAVEHGAAMLLVIACVHVGKLFVKRADGNDGSQHRQVVLWFAIVVALLLWMSPWPFSHVVRPFLRLGGAP
jgi:hypothetical protein